MQCFLLLLIAYWNFILKCLVALQGAGNININFPNTTIVLARHHRLLKMPRLCSLHVPPAPQSPPWEHPMHRGCSYSGLLVSPSGLLFPPSGLPEKLHGKIRTNFETRNIPRRKIPAVKFPPAPCIRCLRVPSLRWTMCADRLGGQLPSTTFAGAHPLHTSGLQATRCPSAVSSVASTHVAL